MINSREIEQLLDEADGGIEASQSRLFELLYDEIKQNARIVRRQQRPNHTWSTTDLAHECTAKLMRSNVIAGLRSKNRRTFYIVAATAMKRLLIDYARTKNAGKNGGGLSKASVELLDSVPDLTRHDVALRLHNALEQLGEIDPRKHDVVMLRFFGGLKNPEVAETLGVSVSTVEKDWQFAKAFLATEIDDEFLDEEVT